MDWTRLGPPRDVRRLFAPEREALLELLDALDASGWQRPTVCPGWDVQDVVGHLLHDCLRRLSSGRDHHGVAAPAPGEPLAAFLTRSNGDFVAVARQISPRVKTGLLRHLGPQLDALWAGRDLSAPAGVDVAWAAPGAEAPTWLDIAREYTELWVHQQQIRDAVDVPGANEPRFVRPVIDTFLRALPHTLDGSASRAGAVVSVPVTGPSGGRWTAVRRAGHWAMTGPAHGPAADAEVEIGAEPLWPPATRGIGPETARELALLHGDMSPHTAVLGLVAVVR